MDAYASFLPFATKSEVLSAVLEGQARPTREKGWLKGGSPGEHWELEAELKAGAMGYEEGYVSKVEAKKWERVSVSLPDLRPPQLSTEYLLTPSGHRKGFFFVQTPRDDMDPFASTLC